MSNRSNFINKLSVLFVFTFLTIGARPAYSIPTVAELQTMVTSKIGGLCQQYGITFCANLAPRLGAGVQVPKKFTPNEVQILTRLNQRKLNLDQRELNLNRRENQLKALQEDMQRQITQLEKLQQSIDRSIASKKTQDTQQLQKAVALYSKMTAPAAAQSLSKLNRKTAVSILTMMKDKQASSVLANMNAARSAEILSIIASKQ